MSTKKYIIRHIRNWRLWLLTALFIVSHGFIQAQQIVITYDNPSYHGGQTSNTSGSGIASDDISTSAVIPTSAINFAAEAWGGGGGGGGAEGGAVISGRAGGGGGGAYVSKTFNEGGYTAFVTVGKGGNRGQSSPTNGTNGNASKIDYNNSEITAGGGGGGYAGDVGRGNSGNGGVWTGSGANGTNGDSGSAGGSGLGDPSGAGGSAANGGGAGGGSISGGSSGDGYTGYHPGGGGGGGRCQIYASRTGGYGGGGRVILAYSFKSLEISVSEDLCQGSAITLTASYEPGTNVTMQWYKNGTAIPDAIEQTYTIFNAQETDNGSYTVKATYNINYPSATGVQGSSLPTGLSISGTSLTGTVTSLPYNLTINPIPIISNSSHTVCSGEVINYTPPSDANTIPAGTTYEWTVNTIAGTISPAPTNGSGSSINLGAFTNNSSGNATIVYTVTPKTTAGCQGANFSFTVVVNNVPEIMSTQTTICSGDTLNLWLKPFVGGTYSSSDESIAYVNPNTGLLRTDVDVIGGNPIVRLPGNVNEGKGGEVDITFTTPSGCSTKIPITVTPRTKTPSLRWEFDGICPVNEDGGHTSGDSLNIATPWNTGGVYFVNHIVWDSLVVVHHEEVMDPNENVKFLKQIKWYEDNNGAPGAFLRQGLDPLPIDDNANDKRMANFWQNDDHDLEVYWATVTNSDSCESKPIEVKVHIETGLSITVKNFIGYVQPAGSDPINLLTFLDLKLDGSQTMEWYATEMDAFFSENLLDPAPVLFNSTEETDTTFWLVKADSYGCRSKATPFRVRLFPMPKISIDPDTLVCPGEAITVKIKVSDGTAPYHFKRLNMNTGQIISETVWSDTTYTFVANPLATVDHRIIEFSDSVTLLVNHDLYGLQTPSIGYFDKIVLSVVITEITGISPASGPTVGGVYTGNPENPIKLDSTVTITGRGFAPFGDPAVSRITFDGILADNIEVIDDHTITCTPPPHLSGYVTVEVTSGCGPAAFTDGYRYDPINIYDVQPAYAPVTGGTRITIRGTGFLTASEDWTSVEVTLAGVPATVVSADNIKIVCITGPSDYSLLDKIIINNGSETREFPESFTYYPVEFIENGKWSEPQRWKTHTADHILPYPGAAVQIKANCLQDISVKMDSIIVHPSKAYTLSVDSVLEANVFILKDNASFINNHSNSGNMRAIQQNVEHILAKGRNWYVSSPLQGGTTKITPTLTKDMSGNDLSGWRVESYNETIHDWLQEGEESLFYTGLGYTAYSPDADIAVKFSGKYSDGNQISPLFVTRSGTHEKRGFNLVGNPFPSYWRWTSETAQQTRLYSTIWYRTWVGGVYEFWSYNASGNVAVAPNWKDATPTGSYSLGYIPPMQAFWVRMMDGYNSATLTFSDNLRAHSDHGSHVLRSTEENDTETRPLLRITAGNGIDMDETVIYADPAATQEFDMYDSDKWFVNEGVELFSLPAASTRELVINGLPEIEDGTEIPLGFQAEESGIFNIRAKEILNLDGLDVFISDKWCKEEFNLRKGDYNFTSSSALVTDRFSIIFRSSNETGIESDVSGEAEADTDKMLVYANKNGQMTAVLHLRGQEGKRVDIAIFDIMGRKLTEQPVIVGQKTILSGTFPGGIYVARAGKLTTKVLVSR